MLSISCLLGDLLLTDFAVRIDWQSPNIDVQVVATKASTYFYSQEDVDNSVRSALNLPDEQLGEHFGVRVWTDEDEWSVRQPLL